jgi:hypothetical protein
VCYQWVGAACLPFQLRPMRAIDSGAFTAPRLSTNAAPSSAFTFSFAASATSLAVTHGRPAFAIAFAIAFAVVFAAAFAISFTIDSVSLAITIRAVSTVGPRLSRASGGHRSVVNTASS